MILGNEKKNIYLIIFKYIANFQNIFFYLFSFLCCNMNGAYSMKFMYKILKILWMWQPFLTVKGCMWLLSLTFVLILLKVWLKHIKIDDGITKSMHIIDKFTCYESGNDMGRWSNPTLHMLLLHQFSP